MIAGGVDFMSDVPIRLSRGMRKSLLAMNKAKSATAKIGTLASGLRHFGLEVHVGSQSLRSLILPGVHELPKAAKEHVTCEFSRVPFKYKS